MNVRILVVVLALVFSSCVRSSLPVERKCEASAIPVAPAINGPAAFRVGETVTYKTDADGECSACLVNGGESFCDADVTQEWRFDRGLPPGGDVDMLQNRGTVIQVKGLAPGLVTLSMKVSVTCNSERIPDCGGDFESNTVTRVVRVNP